MISCEHCRHFQSDTVNPPAGMGRCMHDARHGYFYPGEKHSCRDFADGRDNTIGSTSTVPEGEQ